MKKIFALLPFFILLISCVEDSINPEESFTKIYDNSRSDISYQPIDVVQTDEGYLILAAQDNQESAFFGVQIIEVDNSGNFVSESSLDESHVIPIGEFITIGSKHFFFTMNPASLEIQMVKVGNTATDISNKTSNNELLLLSYSLDDGQTVLSKIDTMGNFIGGNGYTIGPGNEVEDDILEHYIDPERSRLPFFCGEITNGNYYFNGFYNFSLSLV